MQNKILIVEEQSKTTDIISTQLEGYGYITEICHDTDELFSKFKAGAYVLMILDLELSNTDGLWLYQKIRDMDNNIIIFFLLNNIYLKRKNYLLMIINLEILMIFLITLLIFHYYLYLHISYILHRLLQHGWLRLFDTIV